MNFKTGFFAVITFLLISCGNHTIQQKKQPAAFVDFVKNFDTLGLPLVISNTDFLKENVIHIPAFKKIDPREMHDFMKMDSLIPYPVYYYGQLPMLDSTYYLINYFEINDKENPSMWWTLMKFDYFGTLLSETNISYCLKDSNRIEERFCKINPNYQCNYLEARGRWDAKKKMMIDTLWNTRTINLTLNQNN